MGGREKVLEKATEEVINKSSGINNILMKYAPIILGLVCLVVCYLLFKKLQSVSSQSDSVGKLEKQFTSFIKDQSEVNTVNSKRFNAMGSQMNQISYVMQNMSNRPVNEINTQLSPEREING